MLKVKTNVIGFDYDIHSLVKAFYPEEEVRVYSEEECDEPDVTFDFRGAKPDEDRPLYKNEFKIKLYENLSNATGKTLPWGTLTGIRPTKLPMEMIQEGKSDEEIREKLKSTYLVSDEKIDLSIEIAKRELFALRDIDAKEGYSLYIGIPFCPTTCLYCSFTSYPIITMKKVVNDYLDALDKEIDFVAKEFAGKKLDTVYIGGGTPTTLEASELDRLLTKIEESLDLSHIKEFTVEAGRADSITKEKLETLKKHKVTRISVNPQTMNEETLKFIGRKATAAETIEAYKLARSLGFDNINMDIILGLPGEGAGDVARTIEIIKELKPDNLTVHSLAIKRA
ncbi:MAG: coproporphyrinogen dehydrogenase HemZ, partial [Lachnospiraceae bacterium]|nr:coproporphyrinogen dehydrogenase HemZ [Lachnospiraceae bacterium]